MKKLLTIGTVFLIPILAAEQYVSIGAGPDFMHITNSNEHGQKVGYKVGAAYGYKFSNAIRAELEISYRDSSKRTKYVFSEGADEKTHVSSHSMSYLVNVAYDIGSLQTYGLTPYLGGGLGLCANTYELKTRKGDVTTNTDKGKDDRFAWQLIAGAKYPVAEKTEVSLEYKYFNGAYHAKNHSVSAAVIRSF